MEIGFPWGGRRDYAVAMNAGASSPEQETQLQQRMAALGLRESDLEETFVRSAGHGGQNVNKTSTCVLLRHRPSGIQVKCQTTRQQGQNRILARWRLLEKLEAVRRARAAAQRARIEKVRRQKRPRSRAAKERMLADKSHRGIKKESRRRVATE